MQGISCLDAERGKSKSGPCFLSKRQHKLNHADSFSSTNWRANWRLCALRDKLNHLLSPRNYMCILLIYLPCIFVEIIITASLFWVKWYSVWLLHINCTEFGKDGGKQNCRIPTPQTVGSHPDGGFTSCKWYTGQEQTLSRHVTCFQY